MGETARILRYVIPGALMQLPPATWWVLDTLLCCGRLPHVLDHQGVLLALAGATLPLGFLASNIYSWWLWSGRKGKPPVYQHFRPLQGFSWTDDGLLMGALFNRRRPRTGDPILQAAWVDALWHLRMAHNEAALSRGRGLLDFMNGLASSCVALVVGAVLVLSIALISYASDLRDPTWPRAGWSTVFGIVIFFGSLLLAEMLRKAQFRVARTATAYIQAFL